MERALVLMILALALTTVLGGGKRELRGRSVRSADGKTYLIVDDGNGGGCGPIQIDGADWHHALHAAGEIEPGDHQISCGDPKYFIAFSVAPGMTFHFDYWGPRKT